MPSPAVDDLTPLKIKLCVLASNVCQIDIKINGEIVMKKMRMIALVLSLLLSLSSCAFFDVIEFEGKNGEKYFYEYSDGVKTVTNYHPYEFWALPVYQELVQYGDGAGLENDGTVYFIYIVNTSINADDAKAYYSAELDGETKELLCENGEYFADEVDKIAAIERLIYEIDHAYFK